MLSGKAKDNNYLQSAGPKAENRSFQKYCRKQIIPILLILFSLWKLHRLKQLTNKQTNKQLTEGQTNRQTTRTTTKKWHVAMLSGLLACKL